MADNPRDVTFAGVQADLETILAQLEDYGGPNGEAFDAAERLRQAFDLKDAEVHWMRGGRGR